MKRTSRLRAQRDFARIRQNPAGSWPHPLLVLYLAPNELGEPRLGITVSSRVGNAVTRNRVRRRLREAMQRRLAALPHSSDVILVARPRSARASWAELNAALDAVLRRASDSLTAPAVQAEAHDR